MSSLLGSPFGVSGTVALERLSSMELVKIIFQTPTQTWR